MRLQLFFLCTVFNAAMLVSQSLPPAYSLSDDGRMLSMNAVDPEGLYDYQTIRKVYLNFTQPDYWNQLSAYYPSETLLKSNMTVDNQTLEVGVRFRGNTSYTMIQNSQKKSFAVETDFTIPDQRFLGFKNLKFNNAHQDPSFMREVLYSRMARKYTPMAKANYIRLYLNNQDWGLYCNVQDIDKTFLEEYFLSNDGPRFRATIDNTGPPMGGWGDGTAGMNYLGSDTLTYKKYYSLKSSDVTEPWQKLITVCQSLSQVSSSQYEQIKSVIDVDKALWFLAAENIFTDDDSYVMKGKMDYYIYYEPETGRTIPLEYDGNSSFQNNLATASNWGPFKNVNNINYPLLNKLLNVPEFRQRYLAHYRTILQETFTTEEVARHVNNLHQQIGGEVASDNKKLYPTSQYTTSYPQLINFVSIRRNFLLSNAEVSMVGPSITKAAYFNINGEPYQAPKKFEEAYIQATVSSVTGLSGVKLYFATGLTGNFTSVDMTDDGLHRDGLPGDGIFGAAIPGFDAGTLVRYYIEAIANDNAKTRAYFPTGAEHDVFIYRVSVNTSIGTGIAINEIMAQNTSTVKDEAGQWEDWIELYNKGEEDVNMGGYFLSDDDSKIKKWQIPAGTIIPGQGYLIIWADEDEADGPLHASFKLSAGGEVLILSDTSGAVIERLEFGQQTANKGFARIPNGTGPFVIQNPTFGKNNDIALANDEIYGSPWKIYPNPGDQYIVVEKSSNTEELSKGAIYDITGKERTVFMVRDNQIVDVSGLAKGWYVIRIGSEFKTWIKQ
jgi:hypothetical protein